MNENSPGEPGSIEKIPLDLRSYLRSGVAISSFTQCIEELVYNAIDAKATCVAVRIDLDLLKVEVIDNGCGITPEDMKKIGWRYMTSKCKHIRDFEDGGLNFHGYRGEALASIKHISSMLQITSRTSADQRTFVALFVRGKQKPIEVASSSRNVCGTTVVVSDFFYSMPIRRKALNLTLELEDVKSALVAIALSHPHVSVTLRNESSGEKLLQSVRSSSFKDAFLKLHNFDSPEWEDSDILEINAYQDSFKLSGIISSVSYSNKSKQLVFVNKRWLKRSRLLKLINHAFKESTMMRPEKQKIFRTESSPLKSKMPRFPVFLIFLECPLKEVDMTFEPRKTEAEFENWSAVSAFIQDAIRDFLRHNCLVPPSALISTKEALDLPEKETNDYMPNVTGVQPIAGRSAAVKAEIKKTLSVGKWLGSRQGMLATKKNRFENKETTYGSQKNNPQNYIINEKGLFKKEPAALMKRSFTKNSSVLPDMLADIKEKCGQNSSRMRNLNLLSTKPTMVSASAKKSKPPTQISNLKLDDGLFSPPFPALKANETITKSTTSSSEFQGSNITGNISCDSSLGLAKCNQFSFDTASPKASLRLCESNTTRATFELGETVARSFILGLQRTSRSTLSSDTESFFGWKLPLPSDLHNQSDALISPRLKNCSILDENEDLTMKPITSPVDLESIEADALGNATSHDNTLNVISLRLAEARKAFTCPKPEVTSGVTSAGSARRVLNFNSMKKEVMANQVSEPSVLQSSSYLEPSSGAAKKRKKKPWPLPPGTTPFIDKSKRVKVVRKKVESNDTSPRPPSDWVNPILLTDKISCAEDALPSEWSSWRCNPGLRNALKLDKSQMHQMIVIGQVDKKFISVYMGEPSVSSKMLFMFDQHAVHERIRLEDLIKENLTNESVVAVSFLDEPVELSLNSTERRLLEMYQKKCQKFGLFLKDPSDEEVSEQKVVAVGVPTCFLKREASEMYFNRASPMSHLATDLAKELVQTLLDSKGGISLLPKTIRNVLNSQACRGAIMFGDELSNQECKKLIEQLSECHTPFQCAHGRPSIAPIVELDKLSVSDQKTKVNFYNLQKCMNYADT